MGPRKHARRHELMRTSQPPSPREAQMETHLSSRWAHDKGLHLARCFRRTIWPCLFKILKCTPHNSADVFLIICSIEELMCAHIDSLVGFNVDLSEITELSSRGVVK